MSFDELSVEALVKTTPRLFVLEVTALFGILDSP